jgi:hypothetical protein
MKWFIGNYAGNKSVFMHIGRYVNSRTDFLKQHLLFPVSDIIEFASFSIMDRNYLVK